MIDDIVKPYRQAKWLVSIRLACLCGAIRSYCKAVVIGTSIKTRLSLFSHLLIGTSSSLLSFANLNLIQTHLLVTSDNTS